MKEVSDVHQLDEPRARDPQTKKATYARACRHFVFDSTACRNVRLFSRVRM